MNYAYNITNDIISTVEKMPVSMQIKVREYVHILENSMMKKGNAYKLKSHFGIVDDQSIVEMKKAIEEGCENIDVENW